MFHSIRRILAVTTIVTLAACSAEGTTAPLGQSASVALKGGTATGGSTVAGLPSFVGRVDSIGVIPLGFYYGNPSLWVVNGRSFTSQFLTRYRLLNGTIGLGTCVTVSYNPAADGIDYIDDMKSELQSTCDAAAAGQAPSGKKPKVP
jgi:hypothetical protein